MTDPRQRVQDILAAADDAALIVQRGRSAFDGDPLLIRSAKNIVTEVGEAAKLVGPFRDQIPDVPWKQLAGMRDRTVHRYPEVDLDILWDTLTVDLPEIATALRTFMRDQEQAEEQ